MKKIIILILVQFLVVPFSLTAFSQAKVQEKIVSEDDQFLSIKTLVVAPLIDNVSGIYADAVNSMLKTSLEDDHRWELLAWKAAPGANTKALDSDGDFSKSYLKNLGADAVLVSRLQKGPRGISFKLSLVLQKDGNVILAEESPTANVFETEAVLKLSKGVLKTLLNKLPYQGIVMSRQGQKVTFNLGTRHQVQTGNTVSVIRILKMNRHPKSGQLLATEKEVLGKIEIFKADEAMSFGTITFEKNQNMIQPGDKIIPDNFLVYQSTDPLEARKDKAVSFGDGPEAWLPKNAPQFGKFQVGLGLSQYSQSANLATAGAVNGSNSLVPNLDFTGEFWLTKDWYLLAGFRQSAFSIQNGLANSTPSKVNITNSKILMGGGYNFLLDDDYFGPKIRASLGISSFQSSAATSTPIAYTSMNFGGLALGLEFSTPIQSTSFIIGGKFAYHILPTVSENVSSGANSNATMTDFSVNLTKVVRQDLNYYFSLNFEGYQATFSGASSRPDPASSISHNQNTLLGGLEYLF